MTIDEKELREDAKLRIKNRFRQIEKRTTYASRCYEEWYEIWEVREGAGTVASADIAAFELLPSGQGHAVYQISPWRIKLECTCVSGD